MSSAAVTQEVSLDPSDAWLAAYALGLAYSDNSEQQRLTALLEAAQRRPELLEAAYQRLHGADVAERRVCDDALRLLGRAITRVGPDTPRGSAR